MSSQSVEGSATNLDARLSDIFRIIDKNCHRRFSQIYLMALLAFLKTEPDDISPPLALYGGPGNDERVLKRFTDWCERQSQVFHLSGLSEHLYEEGGLTDPIKFRRLIDKVHDLIRASADNGEERFGHIENIIVRSLPEKDRELPESLSQLLTELLEIGSEETVCYPSSGMDFFLQVYNRLKSQYSNRHPKHVSVNAECDFADPFILLSSYLLVDSCLSVYSDAAYQKYPQKVRPACDVVFAFPHQRHAPEIARYIAPDMQALPQKKLFNAIQEVNRQLQTVLDSLNGGGRAAVVIPEATLPLSRPALIDVVVRLPRRLFNQQSANCLVMLKNNKADQTVLFVDASMSLVEDNSANGLDVKKIHEVVRARLTINNLSYLAQETEVSLHMKGQPVLAAPRGNTRQAVLQPVPVKDFILKGSPYQLTPSEMEEPIALS